MKIFIYQAIIKVIFEFLEQVRDFLNDPEDAEHPSLLRSKAAVSLKIDRKIESRSSTEQLQNKYADIAKLKIFQVAGMLIILFLLNL